MKDKEINPVMIARAREAEGLSQGEMANRLGITQSYLSKIEQGLVPPTREIVLNICDLFGYEESFFYESAELFSPPIIYYRKRSSLPKKTLDRLDANIALAANNVEKLLDSADIVKNFDYIEPDGKRTPQLIAMHYRNKWKIPSGPLKNLVDVVEDAGIMVITTPFNHAKLDGMVYLTKSGQPVIYINKDMPGDRQRFSLAHELGHLIMHIHAAPTSDRDHEREADAFAAELMIPEETVRQQFSSMGRITLSEIADLKRYWKMSMGMLLIRASTLGFLTPNQSKYLWMQMSSSGYRTREPEALDVPVDEPSLLKELLQSHLEELDYTVEEIAKMFCIPVEKFRRLYMEQENNLRIVS